MKKNESSANGNFDRLVSYSQRYIPYRWLSKLGIQSFDQDTVISLLLSFILPLVVGLFVGFAALLLNFYQDKVPFYIFFLMIEATLVYFGGIRSGLFFAFLTGAEITFIFRPTSFNQAVLMQFIFGKAVFAIRDRGEGIPKKEQKIIFYRFRRATTDGRISGLGVGLYITHQIVKAHAGTIKLVSSPGSGSAFTVELPLGKKTS